MGQAGDRPERVVLGTEGDPAWRWIAPLYEGPPAIDWTIVPAAAPAWLKRLPGPNWDRLAGARRIGGLVRQGAADLVVSLGPRGSEAIELVGRRGRTNVPHLAMTFNFTDLPTGARRAIMVRAFRDIERFVVFSRMERQLYARTFDLPEERFVFSYWGVRRPIEAPGPPPVAGRYVAALGGEARDYRTLCAAAAMLPHVRFVLVVRPHSLAGLAVPANVEVRTNLPWSVAWTLAAHADVLAVPLRSAETPNGHVTVVGGMHLAKAQVVTDSIGIQDYAIADETALMAPAGDPQAFAHAIERLLDDPALAARIGARAQAFARRHCTEAATVQSFRRQVIDLTRARG